MATSNYMASLRWIAVSLLLFLSACGVDEAPPCGGYGCHTTYTDEQTGVSIRYDTDSRYTPNDVVALYNSTMACTGLYGPGPIVLFVSDAVTDAQGRYISEDRVAIIYPHPHDETAGLPLAFTIMHEFVHHLLAVNGYPQDRNYAHDSPLFATCAR